MKILLPPSEGKAIGTSKKTLDLHSLAFPELAEPRERMLSALIKVSGTKSASKVLGLSPGLASEILANLDILKAPISPAIEIYEGVLYQSLNYAGLSKAGRARANDSLVITSSVFGLLTPEDQIPHYRLSGSVSLPKLGVVSSFWKNQIPADLFDDQLIVDMRSGTYEKFWQPALETNFVQIKVMQVDPKHGQKIAVSHFNKATKGEIANALLNIRRKLATSEDVASEIAKAGWEVETSRSAKSGVQIIEVMLKS
jgi:uncharacterized protein